MRDGYYTAEEASFDSHGWKEFVTLYIVGDKIVTVDYNAKNSSGFIKSWDLNYMREMNAAMGTYPNAYAREYAEALLGAQSPDGVDAVTGATESYRRFVALARAGMERARAGDKSVALVELE